LKPDVVINDAFFATFIPQIHFRVKPLADTISGVTCRGSKTGHGPLPITVYVQQRQVNLALNKGNTTDAYKRIAVYDAFCILHKLSHLVLRHAIGPRTPKSLLIVSFFNLVGSFVDFGYVMETQLFGGTISLHSKKKDVYEADFICVNEVPMEMASVRDNYHRRQCNTATVKSTTSVTYAVAGLSPQKKQTVLRETYPIAWGCQVIDGDEEEESKNVKSFHIHPFGPVTSEF
jgi:hypothetical protein